MKEATKRAASEAFAQMLAVTAMLVIASVIFYWRGNRRLRVNTRRSNPDSTVLRSSGLLRCSQLHFALAKYGTSLPAKG